MKLGIGVGLALLIACSDSADSSLTDDNPKAGANRGEEDGGTGDNSKGGANSPSAEQGAPASDGVLILNAATFYSFRLCFENRGDKVPQPDSTIMPESNVVGVEIGSIVRIDKLEPTPGKTAANPPLPPGRVFVIREKSIRDAQLGTEKPFTCGDLINANPADSRLTENVDYLIAGSIDDVEGVGVKQAEVLAITGCGTKNQLKALDNAATLADVNTVRCGEHYDESAGNLLAKVMPLQASYTHATTAQIPVQLYNVAPAIKALGGQVSVAFDDPAKDGGKDLGIRDTFAAGDQLMIDVDQTDATNYANHAFNVKVTIGGDSVTTSQSLADVQSLSSPTETPTTYYQAASNYALLLLGDPSHKPKLPDGKDNTVYNPRRALHLLAVPVLDPTKDAGAPAADASAGDGGIGTGSK